MPTDPYAEKVLRAAQLILDSDLGKQAGYNVPVVETENFKRVGDWIYIKSSGGAIPLNVINSRVIHYDFPAKAGRNGETITGGEKKIILRSEVGGICISEEGVYGAMDVVIDNGTVEELLQVLA